MNESLDVIIVDDEPMICAVITEIIKTFYSWGDVVSFTDFHEAVTYCRQKQTGVAIFILDVFMGNDTGFSFLEAIADRFPMAYEDTIIMTGNASEDVVNMCIASGITYLIEKPIRTYTLQLAVRAIIAKYIHFAKRLIGDPSLIEIVTGFQETSDDQEKRR